MQDIILDDLDYYGCDKLNDSEYDYLEIGSCDFNVLSMQHPNLKGIIVEPIQEYIDRIPHHPNVLKINCAISDQNKIGKMYYIPSDIIEKKNISGNFRGMNKLDTYHPGAIENNLLDLVQEKECEVFTYFQLLQKYKITYIDFLKIDTEGHDCLIINNILDECKNYRDYILPKYILFENNTLTPSKIFDQTMSRLSTFGYVLVYSLHDNVFVYNVKNFFERNLFKQNIKLPKEDFLKDQIQNGRHYFQNVHTYIEYGQFDLFKNILQIDSNLYDVSGCNFIWTTQNENDYKKYDPSSATIIHIVHGGNNIRDLISKNTKNIVVKKFQDYQQLIQNKIHSCLFIGKYKCLENLIESIYQYRMQNYEHLEQKFLMLKSLFKTDDPSIQSTYHQLIQKYPIDLFSYDSSNGFTNIIDQDPNHNVLAKYKFMIHLKGPGYLCNSVKFGLMTGIPIIMSRSIYKIAMYDQFIPEDILILIDSPLYWNTKPDEFKIGIEKALQMSKEEYITLSRKCYLHGKYFREYYKDEIDHLFYFMNHLH